MAVPARPGDLSGDTAYQPARPLNRITLFGFTQDADRLGADPAGEPLDEVDPLVRAYAGAAEEAGRGPYFRRTIEELLAAEAAGK